MVKESGNVILDTACKQNKQILRRYKQMQKNKIIIYIGQKNVLLPCGKELKTKYLYLHIPIH